MSAPSTVTVGTRRGHALWVSTSLQTRGGISSCVRMLRDTPLWTMWYAEHLTTHRDGSVLGKVFAFAVAVPRFAYAALIQRPDIVHLHMSAHGSFLRKAILFWIARSANIPVLVHVHGSEFDAFHSRAPRPLRALIRVTLNNADVVVALGERWAQRLRTIAPRAVVVTVPNAVRVVGSAHQPAQGEPVHVVFLGEIGERKGTFVLLDAWAELMGAADRPHARLTIAGDREVDRARAMIARLGLHDSVELRPWLSPVEVSQLLAAAQVLALPSRSEGQPMAVLEAMANGLCVVASNVGGIPEMVEDGRSGLLVQPADVSALAAVLRSVVADSDLRARLGEAALRRVRAHFDIDVVWRRFDALYGEVLRREVRT